MPTDNSIGGKVTGKLAEGTNTVVVIGGTTIVNAGGGTNTLLP